MKFTIGQVVKLGIALLVLPLIAVVLWNPAPAPAQAAVAMTADDTAAGTYAGKCKMCHGDKAQKNFDIAAYTEDQMVEIILKGKKGAKPPFMPAYEPKGMNAEQAKALIAFMKTLKQ